MDIFTWLRRDGEGHEVGVTLTGLTDIDIEEGEKEMDKVAEIKKPKVVNLVPPGWSTSLRSKQFLLRTRMLLLFLIMKIVSTRSWFMGRTRQMLSQLSCRKRLFSVM